MKETRKYEITEPQVKKFSDGVIIVKGTIINPEKEFVGQFGSTIEVKTGKVDLNISAPIKAQQDKNLRKDILKLIEKQLQ